MDEHPVVAGEPREALGRGCIVGALRDVDVHAHAMASREVGGGGQRVVRTREGGVHADHASPALAQVSIVLVDPSARAVRAVPIGHPVARVDADTDLGAGIGDDGQRTLDRVRRFVVIDDRRATGLERFECPELRRPFEHRQIERHVEAPPDLFEHLPKSRRDRGRSRHPASECGVQVMVRAHQPWGGISAGGG